MFSEDVDKLTTAEVVARYFGSANSSAYEAAMIFRKDSPDEIRKFVAKRGLANLFWDKLATVLFFEENEALGELLEQLYTVWSESVLQDTDDNLGRTYIHGRSYLANVTYLISLPRSRYGDSDIAMRDRSCGAHHASFLARYLNKALADPVLRDNWKEVLDTCFAYRSMTYAPPIAMLFCRYMLDPDKDRPETPFYEDILFELNETASRVVCELALQAIRRDIWAGDTRGGVAECVINKNMQFPLVLYNVLQAILRYDLNESFSQQDEEYFSDFLKIYLFHGLTQTLKPFLLQGNGCFILQAIAAWTELYTNRESFVGDWTLDIDAAFFKEFLLDIPSEDVCGHRDAWREMQERIRVL